MRAGLLNEVITVQRPYVRQNDYGANEIEWRDYLTTKAQVTYNGGNRLNSDNEIVFAYTKDFTIRYYHEVDEKMRILYKGRLYRILSIEDDRHRQSKQINTELIND